MDNLWFNANNWTTAPGTYTAGIPDGSGSTFVANFESAVGPTVDAAGALGGNLVVGGFGVAGELSVASGGDLVAGGVVLGFYDAPGSILVDGGSLTNTGTIDGFSVGGNGQTGTITLNAGMVDVQGPFLATGRASASAIGSIVVNGGAFYGTTTVYHGDAGTGNLTVNGGVFHANGLFQNGVGGTGNIEVNNTGEFRSNWGHDFKQNTGSVTVNGGVFEVYPGVFWNDGGQANFVANGGYMGIAHLVLGNTAAATGHMEIHGGHVNVPGHFWVTRPGDVTGGTADVTMDGGLLTCGSLFVGHSASGPGSFTLNNGTVSTTELVAAGSGLASSVGNVTINGGSLTTTLFQVSADGQGTVAVNDGQVACDNMVLAVSPLGSSVFTMTGGTVTVNGQLVTAGGGQAAAVSDMTVGGGSLNANVFHFTGDGSGTLEINGGEIVASTMTMAYTASANAVATMNGGVLEAGSLEVGVSGTASLTLNGGTIKVNALSLNTNSSIFVGAGRIVFLNKLEADVLAMIDPANTANGAFTFGGSGPITFQTPDGHTILSTDLYVAGDLNDDGVVDYVDFSELAGQWLDDNYVPAQAPVAFENGNFESYYLPGNDPNDPNYWDTDNEFAFYGPGVQGQGSNWIGLLTNPADAHTGSNALRWVYDSRDLDGMEPNLPFTEMTYYLQTPFDLSAYDKITIWIKRHAGNSSELLLYVKLINGIDDGSGNIVQQLAGHSYLWEEEGSTWDMPDQWWQWEIDLRNLDHYDNGYPDKSYITNMVGLLIGTVTPTGGGTGTIDIDDIELVAGNYCGLYNTADFDYDCDVDMDDFTAFVQDWMHSL